MTKAGKSRDGGGDKSLACIYESVLRKVRNTIKEWCFGKKREWKICIGVCVIFFAFFKEFKICCALIK